MPESKHRRRRGRSGQGGRSATPAARRASAAAPRPSATPPRKRRKTNYLYLAASAIIAVLVIAGFAIGDIAGIGQGGGARAGTADDYVEGVGERQDIMPTANHVPVGVPVTNYNTTPPTSGDHWGTTAACGFYPDGLPDELIVHNLEHGNIIVSYNLATEEEVEQLRQAVDNIALARVWGITRHYEQIEPGTVAVAAWGVLDTMEGVDQQRIRRFFETYAGSLGPEQIDC